MSEHPIIVYPLLIMTAGFFANVSFMRFIKISCSISIIAMYFLDVFGYKPINLNDGSTAASFMRLDQMFQCLIIIEVCFHIVRAFVSDYEAILSKLESEQKTLEYIANHDPLTGLPNRHSCKIHFKKMFHNDSINNEMSHMLLFIDIDDFKNINTRFGHNGGDEALIKVGSRLKEIFTGKNAIVTRIGGDEFIVMLSLSNADTESYLENALTLLSEPLAIFNQKEYITCSMGVVKIEDSKSTFKDENLKADVAMNLAKKTGKNRYCYFDQTVNDIALKDIEIGVGLHEAVKNDEFSLFYQAQVDLESGKIIGAEALIRWITEDGRVISPAEFIPIAEKNGSILEMTYWVIRQACKDCVRWYKEGYEDMFVSVNVSSNVLAEGTLPQIIKQECKAAGLNPKYLELELTESVILENGDAMLQQLQDIRDMNVSLAIDDFGTGYSNLSYLSRLNVQKLKVDQYFVMNLLKSEQDRTIVDEVAQIANSFGMKTVAEGVEEPEVIEQLRELNCTIGQGYIWSKPTCLDSFLQLLSKHSNTAAINISI